MAHLMAKYGHLLFRGSHLLTDAAGCDCCGGVSLPCNSCDPPLADVFHFLLTLDGDNIYEGDAHYWGVEKPDGGPCVWADILPGDIFNGTILNWTGSQWYVAGITTNYDETHTDACDPTGTYTGTTGTAGEGFVMVIS